MNFYIPFAVISILLLVFVRDNKKNAMIAFFIIMLVALVGAAIRYDFGPDYSNYLKLFAELKQYGVSVYIFNEGHSEPAFAYYLSLFPNYTSFIVFNSTLWFGIYYYFFRKYTAPNYLWFVVLFLFFNIDCVLNSLVAMRHAICAYLFILAFYALTKKKKVLYLLIVALCTAIHTSCFILFAFVFLNTKNKSFFFNKNLFKVVVVLSVVLVFLGRDAFLLSISSTLTENVEELERYSVYLEQLGTVQMTAMSIIKYIVLLMLQLIPLFFIVEGGRKETEPNWILCYKLAIIVSIIGLLLGHGLASRYMMLLNPFYIVSIVHTLAKHVNNKWSIVVIVSIIFTSVYSFYFYLQADYCESFLKYHSIFTAPLIP